MGAKTGARIRWVPIGKCLGCAVLALQNAGVAIFSRDYLALCNCCVDAENVFECRSHMQISQAVCYLPLPTCVATWLGTASVNWAIRGLMTLGLMTPSFSI